MYWRLLLGPVLIAGLAGIFTADAWSGPAAPILCLLAVGLAWRGAWELSRLFRTRNFQVQTWLACSGSIVIVLANWWERWRATSDLHVRDPAALGPTMLVFTLVLLGLMFNQAMRYRSPGHSMESLGGEILIVSYIGVLLSLTTQLRWVAGTAAGYVALGSVVMSVKSGDIGAYFIGKTFGRRKLVPALSPGKTWEGAGGALLGAMLGSLLWFRVLAGWIDPHGFHGASWAPLLYGAILGIVGLAGDLCESLMKRDLGQKDSGQLLPEFGGLLDILDSVLYAAPVGYLLWLFLPLW